MSVCPVSAVFVDGLSYEKDFCDMPEAVSYERGFFNMILTRRAVRNFADKPVPKEMLEKIVRAISLAPPGFPPIKHEITVVQDPDVIKKALPVMVDFYEFLYKAFQNPAAKILLRMEAGKRSFRLMESHLIPLLKVRLPGLKKGTEDTITRNAPAMILFHAGKGGEAVADDVYVAAAYCMLAAHAIGLGGSIMDIIPPAINRKAELKAMFGIPDGSEVIASVILGFPRYKYRRCIVRSLKSVRFV
jgi:nitroreductase